MGCSSSKQAYGNGQVGMPVADNHSSGRRSKTKSEDSGISLSAEEATDSDKKENHSHVATNTRRSARSRSNRSKKGVAFEVPNTTSIIKSYPPKRLLSRLEISKSKSNPESVGSKNEVHEQMRQLVQKQVRAEQLRELERHSVVARQKRREERARKVQERKKKLQEEAENWSDEDGASDIDCDRNFNADEDYDFWSCKGSSEHDQEKSLDVQAYSNQENLRGKDALSSVENRELESDDSDSAF